MRRCGKSFLVDPIFKDYLMGKGISENILQQILMNEKIKNCFRQTYQEFNC